MTFEQAIKQLRLQKFKLERPKSKEGTPPFMADWDENRISDYYNKQKDICAALDFAIRVLKGAKDFRKATNKFNVIFADMDAESDPSTEDSGIVAHT